MGIRESLEKLNSFGKALRISHSLFLLVSETIFGISTEKKTLCLQLSMYCLSAPEFTTPWLLCNCGTDPLAFLLATGKMLSYVSTGHRRDTAEEKGLSLLVPVCF